MKTMGIIFTNIVFIWEPLTDFFWSSVWTLHCSQVGKLRKKIVLKKYFNMLENTLIHIIATS